MKKLIPIIALLLSLFCPNILAFTKSKYVTTNLNLRYAPNTSSRVITVIPRGTPVTIDEDCDCKWIPVEYEGKVGYVSAKYLSNNPVKSYTAKRVRTNGIRYYTNVDGYRVQSPTHYDSRPAGATALCRDGTYSFSRNRRGTCSHHGGVARWY